jgi:molybdate transport system ATP-binding protein
MMEVAIQHRQGEFTLSARFTAGTGITALFGPSGAGKTSLMQAIAGLLRPDKARIVVDGVTWNDTDSGVFLDAHKRRIGYVFQEGRLFPHLNVSQNLDYGRFFTPQGERRILRADIIDLLGIGHLLKARPGRLSGGEKSRVAIGRALLMSPRLLLMDEPLASLDQARKDEILPYVEQIRDHWKIPVLYVSHARGEVRRLASRVIMLDSGRIVAEGDAAILELASARLSD